MNADSGKNAAIAIHDPELGRVVFKCKRSEFALQQAFDAWANRGAVMPAIIVQQATRLGAGGPVAVVRKKIVRSDDEYLDHLLDKFVRRPYEVRSITNSRSTIRLDEFVDQRAREVL